MDAIFLVVFRPPDFRPGLQKGLLLMFCEGLPPEFCLEAKKGYLLKLCESPPYCILCWLSQINFRDSSIFAVGFFKNMSCLLTVSVTFFFTLWLDRTGKIEFFHNFETSSEICFGAISLDFLWPYPSSNQQLTPL